MHIHTMCISLREMFLYADVGVLVVVAVGWVVYKHMSLRGQLREDALNVYLTSSIPLDASAYTEVLGLGLGLDASAYTEVLGLGLGLDASAYTEVAKKHWLSASATYTCTARRKHMLHVHVVVEGQYNIARIQLEDQWGRMRQ